MKGAFLNGYYLDYKYMKRFVIEIGDKDSGVSEPQDHDWIPSDEYFEIASILKEAGLYNEISKNIPVICDKCKSFILPIKTLYHTVEKIRDLTDYEIDLFYIEDKITRVVHISLEDWGKFVTDGIKGVNFIYSQAGELITDTEGNPYRFLFEECAVILDSECECNQVMRGC